MGTGPFGEVLSEGEKMEIVNNFIYLGLKINQDASCENEIIRCITMGMHAIRSLMKIWKNIGIFKNDKMILMSVLVFPIVTVSSES